MPKAGRPGPSTGTWWRGRAPPPALVYRRERGGSRRAGVDGPARRGVPYQSEARPAGWTGEMVGPESSADVIYEHLYRRAATIYGGSSEVQKNIIAKGALGL